MTKKEVWINDSSNSKYQRLKGQFVEVMLEHTKEHKINYYDFLLVAKKLSFRFEESSHLMALKNYFAKNKNLVQVKKMGDLLCIAQESLHIQEEKIIVKFTVPDTQFAPIKEETLEDEEDESESEVGLGRDLFQKIGVSGSTTEEEREVNQKMAIILSIKVAEMEKKIKHLMGDEHDPVNLFSIVEDASKHEFNFDEFRDLLVLILGSLREKVKMSEDDIKTIFFVLDVGQKGEVTVDDLLALKEGVQPRLKEFYKSRINRDMVKNTLFKLGKVKNNSIQIYQVKNASVLEFENMEKAIVDSSHHSSQAIKLKTTKIPHFGPLKGAAIANRQRGVVPTHHSAHNRRGESEIKVERERIEKILRHSKQQKQRDKKGETVASKLRSLFIHKVILPREKMLEQEKDRYMKHRINENDLSVRPSHK